MGRGTMLRPLGLRLDGNFRQLQATGSFALIRFATQLWRRVVQSCSAIPIYVEFSIEAGR